MASHENYVTMVGNLVDEPDLRFTGNGAAVCSIRIASSRRYRDNDGNWQDGETTFMTVSAWRSLGENAAESLHRGDRVVVLGRLRVRSYEDREGQTRWVTEIEADEIAPSLRFASAKLAKGGRASSSSVPGEDFGGVPAATEMDDVPF
ncbi:MAG: single-stranded DNA-binding protein [Nitriliruptorales bacterium]